MFENSIFRFKQHLFDLTFIEKIKRWLTNIQVKIKAEVTSLQVYVFFSSIEVLNSTIISALD